MNFPQLLEQNFLSWQAQEGKRKTLDDFADYLDVRRSTLSLWMSGKRSPGPESLRVLSNRLGPEVYDVLGLDRPDPDLAFIEQQWQNLTPQARRAISQNIMHASLVTTDSIYGKLVQDDVRAIIANL